MLLLPATLPAQKQDSINRLLIDSLKQEIEYAGNTQKELELSGALGIYYNISGKYDSARLYLSRALSLPGGKKYEGGRMITNLANTYGFEGRYAEALKYYMEALRVSEQLAAAKDDALAKSNIIRTVANLSEIHYLTGNRRQALFYAERGMRLFVRHVRTGDGIDYMIPQMLYVIGRVHLDRNELDMAEKAMQETCEVADAVCRKWLEDRNDPSGMYMYLAYGMEGLARVSLARKAYARALGEAMEALDFAERHGDPTVTAKILSALSDIYLAQGNYRECGRFAQKAVELFPAYSDVNPGAAFNAAAASLFSGHKEDAYRKFQLYADRMKANTDNLFRETMAGMEVIYETEKKEMRIARLEQEKIFIVIIGAIAGLLAIMTGVIFRQKIRNGQKEKQLVVASAVFEGEKRERERFARGLHDGINGMLSAIRIELAATEHPQNLRDRIDSCIEEIRRLASGVMPVSLQRYGMKAALEDYCRSFSNVFFHFFGENRRIDEKIELMLYYCTCELVHNSVRHSGASAINVQLIQEKKRISLTVQDNGCGYDKTSSGPGVGLKSLRDRITALHGKLEIVSSPEYGTETMIELGVRWSRENKKTIT
ncbi:MAG: tetratricopeptide repeat protein [Tannerella sp.]|nr:tetratricopeptide repeat protein [Tannerella sp.]